MSLNFALNQKIILKAGESKGKSGSFFFWTHDQKFMIKTINSSELSSLLKMLDSYTEHIKNNNSLIVKIYGAFTLKTQIFADVHILIM